MTDALLRIAAAAARRSPMKPKVGAVVARGSRVISLGFNAPGYSSHTPQAWSRHAEVQACLNVNAEGAILYVYRGHGLDGTPMLARPCPSCWGFLETVGIKRVVWTTPEGADSEAL